MFFPLFPWIIYPMLGMFYGHYYLTHPEQRLLMKKSFFSGLVMIAVGALMWRFFPDEDFSVGTCARSGPAVHMVMSGFVFSWMALSFWIVDRVSDNPVFRTLYFWSRNVISVYFIQWILIGWGLFVFQRKTQTAAGALLLGFVFVFLTHLMTWIYIDVKERLKPRGFLKGVFKIPSGTQ